MPPLADHTARRSARTLRRRWYGNSTPAVKTSEISRSNSKPWRSKRSFRRRVNPAHSPRNDVIFASAGKLGFVGIQVCKGYLAPMNSLSHTEMVESIARVGSIAIGRAPLHGTTDPFTQLPTKCLNVSLIIACRLTARLSRLCPGLDLTSWGV